MRARHLATAVLFSILLALAAASVPAFGQAPTAASEAGTEGWTPPLTPWGEPDLQGVWKKESTTPLERPDSFDGRALLTDEEVAARESAEQETVAKGLEGAEQARPTIAESPFQFGNEYNRFWGYTGRARKIDRRTSTLIDPPDGKMPLKPEANWIQAFHAAYVSNYPPEEHYNNSWKDRDTGERCLTDGTLGQMWGGTGPNLFIQGPGYVTILHEQFRDRRIIPTDGRPISPVPTWGGNASGRWEGSTLVVETSQFLDKSDESWQSLWKSATPTLHLIERWTRIGPDELGYSVTVTDPSLFSQPWTVELSLTDLETPETPLVFFEYACHEGNYGIINILSAARGVEKTNPSFKNRRTDYQRWLARQPK
jgi:hypothetical protein